MSENNTPSSDMIKRNEIIISLLQSISKRLDDEIVKADGRLVSLYEELDEIEERKAGAEKRFADYERSLERKFDDYKKSLDEQCEKLLEGQHVQYVDAALREQLSSLIKRFSQLHDQMAADVAKYLEINKQKQETLNSIQDEYRKIENSKQGKLNSIRDIKEKIQNIPNEIESLVERLGGCLFFVVCVVLFFIGYMGIASIFDPPPTSPIIALFFTICCILAPLGWLSYLFFLSFVMPPIKRGKYRAAIAELQEWIENGERQQRELSDAEERTTEEISNLHQKLSDLERRNQEKIEEMKKIGKEELRKKTVPLICTARENGKRELDAAVETKKQIKAELSQKRRKVLEDFVKIWGPSLSPLKQMAEDIRRTQPPLMSLAEEHLNTSEALPDTLVFDGFQHYGKRHQHRSEALPDALVFDGFSVGFDFAKKGIFTKDWEMSVPNLIGFPFSTPIFDAYENTNEKFLPFFYHLLLRLLFALPVGMLKMTVIDPLQMGRSLAPFLPLADTEEIVPYKKFLTISDEIENGLKNIFDDANEIMQKRFHGSITNWKNYNEQNPDSKLPYQLLFVFGFPDQCSDKSVLYLKRLIEFGPRCGILPIITIDITKIKSLSEYEGKQIKEIADWIAKCGRHINKLYSSERFHLRKLSITQDSGLFSAGSLVKFPAGNLVKLLELVKTAYKKHNESSKFHGSIKDMWLSDSNQTSVDGISAPLGWTADGQEVKFELEINNGPPHALLAGRSGSGKSNAIHVLIHSLLHRYSSDELNLYLLDYKEGTEFNVYANNAVSQIKLVAIEGDIEYGITVLEHLADELKRRSVDFKKHNAKDIKEYREKTGEKIPRILLVIDEFQVLFQGSTEIADKVTKLFTTIFKQGRSFGVHILFATQTLSGIGQFIRPFVSELGCRIALSCNEENSRLILSETNDEAVHLVPKKEAILNDQNGVKSANRKFDVPYADKNICVEHLRTLAKQTPLNKDAAETKIFNGANLPTVPEPQWFGNYAGKIVLGEKLNFESAPFAFQWERRMGNNLCVAGINDEIRQGILHSALSSIQHGNAFDKVIYYNADPNREAATLLTGFDIEIRNSDWDCNITDLINDLQNQRILLIIDSLDNADLFYPKQKNYGDNTDTPADLLKKLLEQGPRSGSFVFAFVDNWKRFNTKYKDYVSNFEMRIGFCLTDEDAGNLASGGYERKKGLDKANKAVFANLQQNVQTVFRPFVAAKEE